MNNVIKRIKIDLYSPTSYEVIKAQQGDNNSRVIEFELYNQEEPYIISNDILIRMEGHRGDNSSFQPKDCTVTDNIISVTLDSDVLYEAGTVEAKIVMCNTSDNSILSTIPFKIHVQKNPCDKNKIESEKSSLIDWMVSSLSKHLENKGNPHEVTKSQVGLGNVSNVTTNDQTPTYTEETSISKLVSGEKLSVAFSKISKAISDLMDHLNDNTRHITASERTNWNSAYTNNHTHSNMSILNSITQNLLDNWNAAYTHISDTVKHITASERTLWNTVSNKVDKIAGKGLSTNDYTDADKNIVASMSNGTVTGIKGNAETSYRTGNVNLTPGNIGALPVDGNAASATKLSAARNISLSGDITGSTSFDGTTDKTISTTLANSGVTAGTYGPLKQLSQTGTVWVSNNVGLHSTSAISTWTAKQQCKISFKWKLSSESPSCDSLNIVAAGSIVLSNTGGSTEQTGTLTVSLNAGQTIVFTYRKDSSINNGLDRAEISEVKYGSGTSSPSTVIYESNVESYFTITNETYGFYPGVPIPNIEVDSKGRVTKGQNVYVPETKSTLTMDQIYPIGSIYMSVNSTSPSTLFGGTWVSWGTGRVPVGIDTSQTEFNTMEKTGGSATASYTPSGSVGSHTLTTSEIPSHKHSVSVSGGSHSHEVYVQHTSGSGSKITLGTSANNDGTVYGTPSGGSHTHTVSESSVGGSSGHNHTFTGTAASISTLPPYITCYMWKRTA